MEMELDFSIESWEKRLDEKERTKMYRRFNRDAQELNAICAYLTKRIPFRPEGLLKEWVKIIKDKLAELKQHASEIKDENITADLEKVTQICETILKEVDGIKRDYLEFYCPIYAKNMKIYDFALEEIYNEADYVIERCDEVKMELPTMSKEKALSEMGYLKASYMEIKNLIPKNSNVEFSEDMFFKLKRMEDIYFEVKEELCNKLEPSNDILVPPASPQCGGNLVTKSSDGDSPLENKHKTDDYEKQRQEEILQFDPLMKKEDDGTDLEKQEQEVDLQNEEEYCDVNPIVEGIAEGSNEEENYVVHMDLEAKDDVTFAVKREYSSLIPEGNLHCNVFNHFSRFRGKYAKTDKSVLITETEERLKEVVSGNIKYELKPPVNEEWKKKSPQRNGVAGMMKPVDEGGGNFDRGPIENWLRRIVGAVT